MNEQKGSMTFVVAVCLVAALGGLLFGYDTAVISGAIGFMQSHFDLNAAQKGWAASSALVGCIIGAAFAGTLSDRFGRRRALIFAAIMYFISAVGSAIPDSVAEFVFYRIVGGVGVGAASMISPMYIAEITPAKIRGRMVSVNQFAIISGMLMVYFVNYFIAKMGNQSWNESIGWRWMFGSEAIPAAIFFFALFFVPESPRWLAAQGKKGHERAMQILSRVGGSKYAADEMDEIQKTVSTETSSIAQLFQPGMKRVLLIGVSLAVLQQITGINVFLYYAPEIFKSVVKGTGTNIALLQTIVVGAVNLLFTVVAIRTVDKLGRKPLMLIGSAGMGITLFGMGFASYFQRTEGWVLTFILGYIACFALSVGPVTWVILSEIFPNKIRGRAMAIATLLLWTANYIVSQTFPMMDENKWLVDRFHHAFPFMVYGMFCIVTVVFVLKLVPETKGRSLEQIEMQWTKGRVEK